MKLKFISKNKKGISPIAFFMLALVVVTLGAFTLGYTADVQRDMNTETLSASQNQTYLSEIVLSPTGEGISSPAAQVYNQTWLDFDGEDDRIQIDDNINYSAPFSISFWMKKPSTTDAEVGYIAGKHDVSKTRVWNIHTNDGNDMRFNVFQNGSDQNNFTIAQTNSFLVVDTWYHFVASYNGSEIFLYKNGEVIDSEIVPPIQYYDDINVTLGNTASDSGYYNGSIDDFKIYNYSLRTEQVRSLYNSSAKRLGMKIPVLSYHQVRDDLSVDTIVNTTNFDAQMGYLSGAGFTAITFEDYYNWIQGDFVMPKKPVIIVFDDGFVNVYTNAYPIMDSYGLVGVNGLISRVIGQDHGEVYGRMNWTEIQELQTEGWGVAAHSINSSHLTTLSGEQRQEAFTEIKEVIQGNLSVTPIAFIYPGNQHNDTIDSECGEHYLICTGESSGDQQPYYSYKGSDLTGGVHRLLVDNETSIESFRRAVDSFYGLEVGYKMNENQGSVIYDFGDNSNNVSVDGASWENDNSLVSLNDVDYNVSGDSFTLSGEDYMFSWVNINWDYSNVRSLASNTGLTVAQVFIALIVLGFMAFGLKQWMDN